MSHDLTDPADQPVDEHLLELADSVATGGDVDWASASTAHDPVDRELLEQLKLIDAVARLHRGGLAAPRDDGPTPPLAAGERWAQLVIVERVSGGTFGDVYLARDTALDRDVALKLLRSAPVRNRWRRNSWRRAGCSRASRTPT